jgi:hypothetical protein
MLNLALSTDKLQLVTAAASTLDVVASFVDLSGSTVTPGKQLSTITTAATSDIVGAPAATTFRNLKSLFVRNRGALSCAVTILFNANGTAYEIYKTTLNPGDTLMHMEDAGFVVYPASQNRKNISTADQGLAASALAVISGSSIDAANMKVGTVLQWRINMDKTAAGTASQTFGVAFGTAGTTADTVRLSTGFATGTQTAVADVAEVKIRVVVRNVSATGVVHGSFHLDHNLASTGFAPVPNVDAQQTSGTFDLTVAGLLATISTTPGAAAVTTVHQCIAERVDP